MRAYIPKKSLKDFLPDTISAKSKKQIKSLKRTIFKIISKVVMSLSLFEFAGALEVFNTKILLLAVVVCVLTGLVKLLFPQKFRKFVTAIPFILGIIVCAVYDLIFEKVNPISPHTVSIGIQTGVASTIYYVVYDQFFKSGNGERSELLASLLAAVINQDSIKGSIKGILAVLDSGSADAAKKIFDIIDAAKAENATVEEIMLTVKNILSNLMT